MRSGLNGVGTAMTKASASGISVDATRRPALTASATLPSRSGSTKGTSPRDTAATVAALTSTPTTWMPRVASTAAVGSPM